MTSNIVEKTIWQLVDSHWTCINREYNCDGNEIKQADYGLTLAEYLWLRGFDIPETITYCLAKTERYELKYRVYGGQIIVYLKSR